MNYEPNKIQWRRGSIVIHDTDAKEPKMLMRVIGFQRETGWARCQYVDKRKWRSIYAQKTMECLHDPARFKINPDWGNCGQAMLEHYQEEFELVRRWNLKCGIGTKVRTLSADGNFEAITLRPAFHRYATGDAIIQLQPGGLWLLRFVELVR